MTRGGRWHQKRILSPFRPPLAYLRNVAKSYVSSSLLPIAQEAHRRNVALSRPHSPRLAFNLQELACEHHGATVEEGIIDRSPSLISSWCGNSVESKCHEALACQYSMNLRSYFPWYLSHMWRPSAFLQRQTALQGSQDQRRDLLMSTGTVPWCLDVRATFVISCHVWNALTSYCSQVTVRPRALRRALQMLEGDTTSSYHIWWCKWEYGRACYTGRGWYP
jgi:hypothetical protein